MRHHLERVDHRVLGALRIVEAAEKAAKHRPIERPFRVISDSLRFVRNASGLVVITHAEGLQSYTDAFEAAPNIAQKPFKFWIEDPLGQYYPREATILLPLDANVVSQPVEVELLPTPMAPTTTANALVRVIAKRSDNQQPYPGVLVGGQKGGVVSWTMTDANGEALMIIPGLRRYDSGDGTPTLTTVITLSFIAFPSAEVELPAILRHAQPVAPGYYRDWRSAVDQNPILLKATLPGDVVLEDVGVTPGTEVRVNATITIKPPPPPP